MTRPVMENIDWVGIVDWELRSFHGNEYSTHKGSSYNSYLIREEKNVLIDTVYKPFANAFLKNLCDTIDLNQIDAVIANHAESDHSGALPLLLERIPNVPIYCTANGVKSLKGHYRKEWNWKVVKTGDTLALGNGKELVFIEAPMLHWPDSMMGYLTGDAVLFSNDAFGHHYASEMLFNDLVDQAELAVECMKYYANILTPFSRLVTKKIEEFLALNLPLSMICPSHGIVWRNAPTQIVTSYLSWAAGYQENQISILYDTMWDATRHAAEAIAEGIREQAPSTVVKIVNISKTDKNDVILDVFKSKGIIVGSPTVNRGILSAVAGILEEIRGLGFIGKCAAAFGSYGWSGESVKMIEDMLKNSGFAVSLPGLKVQWNPDDAALLQCREFGKSFSQS